MIYSKINKYHHIEFLNFKNLFECKFQDDDIFYHHHYYEQQENIKIYDCVDEQHWNHIRTNPNTKILHENCGETFSHSFVSEVVKMIKDRNINPQQVYIIVMDDIHKKFLIEGLAGHNISVNVGVGNFLMSKITFPEIPTEPCEYRFSSLSRNYRVWRLQLYAKLEEKGILDKFVYSFFNIHPYEGTVFPVSTMLSDLKNSGTALTERITNWVDKVPYKLTDTDNVLNKWADATYQAILSADMHLIIETHYDLFYYVPSPDKVYNRNLAPSFITEKVYKGISCNKPFIVFSTPYFLEDLRSLGFETFSPYINESYDQITDNQERLNTIVAEIERLVNLPPTLLEEILAECGKIAERNLSRLKVMTQDTGWSNNFIFVQDNIKPNATLQIL